MRGGHCQPLYLLPYRLLLFEQLWFYIACLQYRNFTTYLPKNDSSPTLLHRNTSNKSSRTHLHCDNLYELVLSWSEYLWHSNRTWVRTNTTTLRLFGGGGLSTLSNELHKQSVYGVNVIWPRSQMTTRCMSQVWAKKRPVARCFVFSVQDKYYRPVQARN